MNGAVIAGNRIAKEIYRQFVTAWRFHSIDFTRWNPLFYWWAKNIFIFMVIAIETVTLRSVMQIFHFVI
jgi:hypothetical protein